LVEGLENFYIKKGEGVLHIGGHFGQEAARYDNLKAKVIWIEALPDVHRVLKQNIVKYENQLSICALLGEENIDQVPFYVASNNFASSSVYQFGRELRFKGLKMETSTTLKMKRLDHVITEKEASSHNHWVIDVQGAELLVLKGAGSLLRYCQSLLIEISTREVYAGAPKWEEIRDFLYSKGLSPVWNPLVFSHENILFLRS
jgi:FkbM family methyltransferase